MNYDELRTIPTGGKGIQFIFHVGYFIRDLRRVHTVKVDRIDEYGPYLMLQFSDLTPCKIIQGYLISRVPSIVT